MITTTPYAERQYKKLTERTRSVFMTALEKFVMTPPEMRGKQWRHLRDGHAGLFEEKGLYSWRAKRGLRLLLGERATGYAIVSFAKRGSKAAGYRSET